MEPSKHKSTLQEGEEHVGQHLPTEAYCGEGCKGKKGGKSSRSSWV